MNYLRKKLKANFFEIIILIIIVFPAFSVLLQNGYFTMHDDQHIVRLYLLHEGLMQGAIYPRWVDGLGFSYGYPLFNFYPPLIYYLGEFFHLAGFSLIWSIKMVIVLGFIAGAYGIYLYTKELFNRASGYVAATLYTFSFYHAVVAYVRGALAEFISMSIFPFVLHSLYLVFKKPSKNSIVYFGISFALLVLCHPLIAFPSIIFLAFFILFYFFTGRKKIIFTVNLMTALFLGLGLSLFYWLPSLVERSATLVESILTKELANYTLHFVYPQQLIYSLWGYGGSVRGPADGITFQLGKIHIFLTAASIFFAALIWLQNKKSIKVRHYFFSLIVLFFAVFMLLPNSRWIWDQVHYLWYLQFPWRFLTFVTFFLAVLGSTAFYFSRIFFPKLIQNIFAITVIILTIVIYGKYFRPQQMIKTTDLERATKEEINWRISKTSFEFAPKGVATKKTDFDTTTIAIEKNELPEKIFAVDDPQARVTILRNSFNNKSFRIVSEKPLKFRLNTFYFPGWQAYEIVNGEKIKITISDDNSLKLSTIRLPAGTHQIRFIFEDTPVRKIGNYVSLLSLIIILISMGTDHFNKFIGRFLYSNRNNFS